MAPKPAARSKSPAMRKDTGKEAAPADADGDATAPKKPAVKKAPKEDAPADEDGDATAPKKPAVKKAPKEDAPADGAPAAPAPAKKAPAKPLGKKMRDGYWQGNLKLFKPQGKGIYIYNNGDKYDGTMVEGRRHTDAKGNNRKAKFWWANGAKYVGQYVKHRQHGEGKLWFPDGTTLNTNWKNDLSAVTDFMFKNGDVYTGGISTCTMHGAGCLRLKNGDIYTGEFSNNMFHGQGEYKSRSGDVYKGNYAKGKPGPLGSRGESGPGAGSMTFASGDVYYGEFDSGIAHGRGQLRYADGDIVDTEFVHGRWQGTHTYGNGDQHTGGFYLNEPEGGGRILFRSGDVFEGEFEDGRFHFAIDTGDVQESGTFKSGALDGNGRRAVGREVYQGEFREGFYHGVGVLEVEATGLRYEGEFRSGKFCGAGSLVYGAWPEGARELKVTDYLVSAMVKGAGFQPEDAVYEGTFLDGCRHGNGVLQCRDETYEGEFVFDFYHGKGTWTCHLDTPSLLPLYWVSFDTCADLRQGDVDLPFRHNLGWRVIKLPRRVGQGQTRRRWCLHLRTQLYIRGRVAGGGASRRGHGAHGATGSIGQVRGAIPL